MKPGIDVIVREVGLRDGIQNISAFMPTADKLAWLVAEADAGMSEIEVCSFVPPKVIPQFTDAAEVTARALQIPGLIVSALIPNLKGAERGIAAGVHKLNFVMSVSASHNQANVRRTREESVVDFANIAKLIKGLEPVRRPVLAGGLSTALGCTIEGQIAEADVVRYAVQLAEAGADEICVADTVGYADPASVRRIFKSVQACGEAAAGCSAFPRYPRPWPRQCLGGPGDGRRTLRCLSCRSRRLSLRAGRVRQHCHGGPRIHAGEHRHENRRGH